MIFTKNKTTVIDRKNKSIATIHLTSDIVAIFLLFVFNKGSNSNQRKNKKS